MKFRPISFRSPEENIYFDEVLFDLAEQGVDQEALRFWESPDPFIVLGKTSNQEQDLKLENIAKDKFPVVRRFSAGGTVVQGKGCLNFTCVLLKDNWPQLRMIRESYQFILGKIINALHVLDVEARFYPPCDLAIAEDQRKFSGNAQRRGKRVILHHGTILCDLDIGLAQEYLQFPIKVPDYRRKRGHEAFMANIYRNPEDVMRCIVDVFGATEKDERLSDLEQERLRAIVLARKDSRDLMA